MNVARMKALIWQATAFSLEQLDASTFIREVFNESEYRTAEGTMGDVDTFMEQHEVDFWLDFSV
jgi:hypothetical protein